MKDNTDFLTEIVYPDGIERSAIGKVPAKQPDNITKGAYKLSSAILSSLQSKRLSRVLSNTTVQKNQFFGAQPSLRSTSHIHT